MRPYSYLNPLNTCSIYILLKDILFTTFRLFSAFDIKREVIDDVIVCYMAGFSAYNLF